MFKDYSLIVFVAIWHSLRVIGSPSEFAVKNAKKKKNEKLTALSCTTLSFLVNTKSGVYIISHP